MALTPEDVSNKRFTPTRLREGYDQAEVDQFLDEVETELHRLTRENDDLRRKLSGAQAGDGVAEPATGEVGTTQPAAAADTGTEPTAAETTGSESTAVHPTGSETTGADPASGSSADAASTEPAATGLRPYPAPSEVLQVTTAAEASAAATRLLELATRNADELYEEARAQAIQVVGDADAEAERRRVESQAAIDKQEADARARTEMLDTETEQRRGELFGDLETEQRRLNAEIDDLRTFEREYRSRLRTYFEQQLESLDATGDSIGEGLGEGPGDGLSSSPVTTAGDLRAGSGPDAAGSSGERDTGAEHRASSQDGHESV